MKLDNFCMKHLIISIFILVFIGLNTLFSQIVADTFNVPKTWKLYQNNKRKSYRNNVCRHYSTIFHFCKYPNPTNNILYCDIYNQIEQDAIIEIFNITGQLLYKQTPKLYAGINSYEFDVKQFKQGIYVLKVSFYNKSQTQRFVVAK